MIEKLMVKLYGPNWKTSLNGDLSFLITVGTFVSGYLVITPNSPRWLVGVSGVATLLAALGRRGVGRIQVDAGTTPAILPGSSEVQMAPSHEVLDDPAAVPVVPAPK